MLHFYVYLQYINRKYVWETAERSSCFHIFVRLVYKKNSCTSLSFKWTVWSFPVRSAHMNILRCQHKMLCYRRIWRAFCWEKGTVVSFLWCLFPPVFGLPVGSIACCLFPAVSHLKAVFVPSLWLRFDHTSFSTACFTQCHMLWGWPWSRHRCNYNTVTGRSHIDCSSCAAAFLDWLFSLWLMLPACLPNSKHFHTCIMNISC